MAYRFPCVRFVEIVSPSFSVSERVGGFVVHAVPSATFNDLAGLNATLGNRYWLGFTISGLSPNKKRLALLGAQQNHSGHDHGIGGGVVLGVSETDHHADHSPAFGKRSC